MRQDDRVGKCGKGKRVYEKSISKTKKIKPSPVKVKGPGKTPQDADIYRKGRKGSKGRKVGGGRDISSWVLPDRIGFADWVSQMFTYQESQEELAKRNERDENYNNKNDDDDLFVHQKFVRDYLRDGSPYPGLLLFHAVGVGKSRASIAALNVLADSHNIFVMLKASIRNNYVEEIRRFGVDGYARAQRWIDVSGGKDGASPPQWEALSETSSDNSFEFDDLPDLARDQIRAKLTSLLEKKIRFVHYNGGLTKALLEEFCDGPLNPFEQSVVVIDEAHNFISTVTNGGLARHIYERMMQAEKRKVILLTGTPFVNNAIELPFMLNLVRGFVRTLYFSVTVSGREDLLQLETDIRVALEQCLFVNRTEISYDVRSNRLWVVVEPTPPGFTRISPESYEIEQTHEFEKDWKPGGWTLHFVGSKVKSVLDRVVQQHRIQTKEEKKSIQVSVPREELNTLFPMGDAFLKQFTKNSGRRITKHKEIEARSSGLISYFAAYDREIFPEKSEVNIVKCAMSDHQFDLYRGMREEERKQDRINRIKAARRKDVGTVKDSDSSTYRSYSRQVCTFAFPSEIPRPYKKRIVRTEIRSSGENVIDANNGKDLSLPNAFIYEGGGEVGEDNRLYDRLLSEATEKLMSEEHNHVLKVDGDLKEHSPKFYEMINRLKVGKAPALIYSQYRTTEGVGLFTACLDMNGYSRLMAVRDSTAKGGYRLVLKDRGGQGKRNGGGGHNRYMIYDSSDREASNLLLKVFNSEFDMLPDQVMEDIRGLKEGGEIDGDENLHGKIAKVMLVTTSGAESLTIRNVREVHMIEPYWNTNRINQVIGRAVRAHSHARLPREERRVDIYLYFATFTEAQLEDRAILKNDEGKTSDEHLYDLAMEKSKLTDDMSDILRKSAVDCRLHLQKHLQLNPDHACSPRIVGKSPADFAYELVNVAGLPGIGTVASNANAGKKEEKRLRAVMVDGVRYYMDEQDGALYDYNKLKNEGKLEQINL